MMRRWLVTGVLALAAFATAAMAMDQASVPRQFPIPWGSSAGSNYIRNIPEASQIGSQNCAASLTDGFPPLTFTPSSQGGCPPFGQDMNGILKQLSQWSQWQGAGAHPLYDSSFSSSIGGYPSGAILANAGTPGCFWISLVDNNASDPDTGGANWNASCPGGGIGAGSTGSANAQVISAPGFILKRGQQVVFTSNFTNTGLLRVNVNGLGNVDVYRRSQLGLTATAGGEVAAGAMVQLAYNGTQFELLGQTFLIGEGKEWYSTTAPPGSLFQDGSAVSRSTYADLFAVIGTTYGSGDGSTTFNLPDQRGRMAVMKDGASRITTACAAANTLGTVCGNATGGVTTIAQNQLPNTQLLVNIHDPGHSHGIVNGNVSGNAVTPTTLSGPGVTNIPTDANTFAIATATTSISADTVSMNGGVSQQTLQVLNGSVVVNKIIRY
jgi:microcystin-dependent protein